MPVSNRLLPLLLCLPLSGRALERFDFSGPGMATTFRIACHAETRDVAERAARECFERVAFLHAICTDYDPASELMRLCAPGAVHPFQTSAELYDILLKARELAVLTQGAFNPACGHLTQLWRRTRRTGKLPPEDRLQRGLKAADWQRMSFEPETRGVTLAEGTLLDLGGIAKGWAADECLRLLKRHGITRAVVQAGGDTAVGSPPPGEEGWEIKLRTFSKPGGDDELRALVLAECAVSTSGDLYQFTEIGGVRYSHIVSPFTGMGLTERVACSVIAPDCATSDALATAMCVLGEQRGTALAAGLPGVRVIFAGEKK
ncbi:MAG TPA: FAD:protein FMN transferase [Prosthecobacter sp.]|nr:FAD:protein FMN transferase [Prosthecobacter sp.]HRK12812.1 FAD:protein FMN transferase [Prosthecobacter sp.]